MRLITLILISGFFTHACAPRNEATANLQKTTAEVNRVLDDWHNAASVGDFERYFNHFENDSSIFMGTDATERWTVAVFRPWSEPHFADGMAWDFSPVFRKVYMSESGNTAWFDEMLDTPNLGPVRGSGVLVKQGEAWKIAHYNLSIPIPNSIADDVVQQINKELNN